MEDVCRLAEDQAEVGPLDQQIVEVDEAFAACDACRDLGLLPLWHWGPQPSVNAPLQLGQVNLHVNRRPKLRVPRLQCPEFGDLAWFHAAGAQAGKSVGGHGGFLSGGRLFRNPVTL